MYYISVFTIHLRIVFIRNMHTENCTLICENKISLCFFVNEGIAHQNQNSPSFTHSPIIPNLSDCWNTYIFWKVFFLLKANRVDILSDSKTFTVCTKTVETFFKISSIWTPISNYTFVVDMGLGLQSQTDYILFLNYGDNYRWTQYLRHFVQRISWPEQLLSHFSISLVFDVNK